MSRATTPRPAAAWVYEGVWGVLSALFRVPRDPPTLPFHDAEAVETLQPADGFLSYLKFQLLIFVLFLGGCLLVGWIILLAVQPVVGAFLAVPMLALVAVPSAAYYLAIYVRYDTTWFLLTDRSMRIRRGVWTIRETTITFENIQNVVVRQGPIQRFFRIADVVVQTAGGGSQHGPHGEQSLGAHVGLLEGLAEAPRIRDLIQSRLRQSPSAGLGDEAHPSEGGRIAGWTPEQLAALRRIRDLARALAAR